MDAHPALATLTSAPVLAFALGALAIAVRSDLRVPEAITKGLSLYLLLAIGLKGGVALRSTDPGELVIPLTLGLVLGLLIPVLAFGALRVLTPYSAVDRGSIAAHYGSTSLVTFTAAVVSLTALDIDVPGYAAALLTVLEIPGLLVGLLLARRGASAGNAVPWSTTVHEILTGSSIVLLAGGLAIGATIGEAGFATIAPLFDDAFRGVLVLFLLGLGIDAAQRLRSLRRGTLGLVVFAVVFPLVIGSAVVALASVVGLGVGGAVVLAVLCASASYIAAPAAVRLALPEANLAYPLTASLAVTFPVNLVVGIPLLTTIALSLAPVV